MILQSKASVVAALLASGSGKCPYLQAMHDELCMLHAIDLNFPNPPANDRTKIRTKRK